MVDEFAAMDENLERARAFGTDAGWREPAARLLAEVRELREAVGPAIDGRAWKIRAERAEGLLREAGDALAALCADDADEVQLEWAETTLARIRAALPDNTEGR